MKCKLHPTYKAIRKPTSKKEGCKCAIIWHGEQAKKIAANPERKLSDYDFVIDFIVENLPPLPKDEELERYWEQLVVVRKLDLESESK